jgi:hypothetical protein
MKDYLLNAMRALAVAVAALLPVSAHAQTVVKQPQFIQNQQWADLGNGPLDIQPVEGNGAVYSALGTGVGSTSGSSTTLTLTATPAIAPLVGGLISGAGITSGTTVSAFNGTTTITLSAAMTVAASTPIAWGAACPAATAANVPGTPPAANAQLGAPLNLRSGIGSTYPLYTQARLCAYGAQQNGFSFLSFAIGAH